MQSEREQRRGREWNEAGECSGSYFAHLDESIIQHSSKDVYMVLGKLCFVFIKSLSLFSETSITSVKYFFRALNLKGTPTVIKNSCH